MKKFIIYFIILFCAKLLYAQENSCTVTINLDQFKLGKRITLRGENFKQTIEVDEQRTATFKVPATKGNYYTLATGICMNEIYLEPGTVLNMKAVKNEKGEYNLQRLDFEYSGPTAKINAYLNQRSLQEMKNIDFLLPEKEYIKKIEALVKANIKTVKRAKLDKEFTKQEIFRTKYQTLEPLTRYPVQHYWKNGSVAYVLYDHEDTPIVKEHITKQFIDSQDAWQDAAYRRYVYNAIGILDHSFNDDKATTLRKKINVMTKHFNNPGIQEDLVQKLTLGYIENAQVDALNELQESYDRFVKKEAYRKEVDEAFAAQKRFKKGQNVTSAAAPYIDMEGKAVSLSDLKGKYIYIDVWATWCGPCRGELPHLKKLEEAMHGKNIYFVSISTDARRKDWMKMVEREKLGGIQLHGGPEAPIVSDYKITGIPRFILLDRDGKLINSDMTRPSDPQTLKTLNALEGI